MKILIQNSTVIPLTEDSRVRENCHILIENDKFIGIGTTNELADQNLNLDHWKPDRTIQANDLLAIPGFVNAHTHAAMSLFRSFADDMPLLEWLEKKIWPAEARLTSEDVYWGTLLAIIEMLKSGTTCFADMYFFMPEVAKAVEESGIRASLARGLIGIAPEGEKSLDEGCQFAVDWRGKGNGRISVMLGPHAPYTCTPNYLEKVIRRAKELNLGLHIHLAETRNEVIEIQSKYGTTPVSLMNQIGLFDSPVLAAHCVHLSEEEMQILARSKVGIAHNPESNMKLASGIAPIQDLLSRNAIVALGTDGPASNNNLDLIQEMRSASLLQKVASGNPTALSAYTSLEMATVKGAAALGLDSEIGRITPGAKADLVLLDTRKPHWQPLHRPISTLVFSSLAADVSTVIVDGKILLEKGRVLTVDENEVFNQVRKRADRLVSDL